MRKALRDLAQVLVEGLKAALRRDLAPGIGKHRAVAGLDGDLIAEGGGELLKPALGHIGPDTEDVGIVGNLKFLHGVLV